MKRITYGGRSLVTAAVVADALLDYAVHVAGRGVAVVVEVPVLEENGDIASHALLLGPGTALDVVDIDGYMSASRDGEFAIPDFPPLMVHAMSLDPADAPELADPFEMLRGEMAPRPA